MSANWVADSKWTQLLNHLESRVSYVERTAENAEGYFLLPPWTPPTDLGECPSEYVARARNLLERHEMLITKLAEQATKVHHELEFLRATPSNTESPVPHYVDQGL